MTHASYVHGAAAQPLIGETIGRYFDAACARYAAHDALVVRHQNVRLSYTELKLKVDALACSLIRLGLKPGERIGIWSQNNLEWTLTQFATAKAGLVLVNINPAYRRAELEYALNKVGCRALILSPAFKSSDYLEMLTDLAPELATCTPGALRSERLPALETVIRMGEVQSHGMLNFDTLLSAPSLPELQALEALGETLQFDDPINIQFTSGTTGNPKGATLSHHNILNNGFFVAEAIGLSEADRLCIPVPLYHCFGMVMGNLGCLTHGATMVYPSEAFEPLAALETLAEEHCTAMYGVPTMFIAVLDHPRFGEFDVSTLRTGIMAGSPCPTEVMKRVVDKMNMGEVTIAYGMTETSPVSFQSGRDDPLDRRVSTVGRVQPHCEVKIVDTDGRIVPRGTPGELCTRGYSVMLGYWGDEAKTREAIDAAGWMHTGDIATIDDEGYCNIVGRIKDMVIRGGENIYPREIEEFLYRHPKIVDVQVVGVPDQKYGEALCAWIILREGESMTEDEVRRFCQGQIAHYKIPAYIRFTDSFPMTVTGKIQKFQIRERMKQELGLNDAATA
ncbi:AMP-binding protein [Denitromonas ohlonensis]|uniref:AMP-binding protein n=2 Tax=Denitromonas TaxID=139331 RepID=A0A557SPX8_9RHOO|nr:AMP-binding protein [Denitromonas ohlonensis]TVT49783.1 MAG: AMP-binding protein [Denitromonas halophila]TVO65880.1 AMP-binding protein [Denitromonas ohlonensis]TVO79473.1 AMP-binding protein [Denitromonas ohlonensis]TVT69411.1 MAG: AMP-binding protein [Denitromonas halophila]TVT75866.1 MAG: AMP-binding protein [Denitromonas halophila]